MVIVPNKTRDDYDVLKIYNPHDSPVDIFQDGLLIQGYYKITNDGINTEIYFLKGQLQTGSHISYKIASTKRKRYDYSCTPETTGFLMLPFNPEAVNNLEVYINGIRTVDIKKEDSTGRVCYTHYNNIYYMFLRTKMEDYSRITVMYDNHEYTHTKTVPYTDHIEVPDFTVDYFKTDIWLDGRLMIPNIHYKIYGNTHILFNKGTTGTEIIMYNEKYQEIYPETDTSYDKILMNTITDIDQLRPTGYLHGSIPPMVNILLFVEFIIYVTTVLKTYDTPYVTEEKSDLPFDELATHMSTRVDPAMDPEIKQTYPAAGTLLKGVSFANTLIEDKGTFDYTFMKIGYMTNFKIYNGIDEIEQEENFNTDGYYYLWNNDTEVDNVDGADSSKGIVHGTLYKPDLRYIIKEQSTLDDIYNKPTIIQLLLNLDQVNNIISAVTDYRIHDEFSIVSKVINLYYVDGNNNRSLVETFPLGKHVSFISNKDGLYQAEIKISYRNNLNEIHEVTATSNTVLIWSPPIIEIIDEHVLDSAVSIDTRVSLGVGNHPISYLTEVIDVNTGSALTTETRHQISPNTVYDTLPEGSYYIRFSLSYNFIDSSSGTPVTILKPSITISSSTFTIIGIPTIDELNLVNDTVMNRFLLSFHVNSKKHVIVRQQIGFLYDTGAVYTGADIGNPFVIYDLDQNNFPTGINNGLIYNNINNRHGKFKAVMIVSYENTITGVVSEIIKFSNSVEKYITPEILDFDIYKRDGKIHLVGGDTVSYTYDNKHTTDIKLKLTLTSLTSSMSPIEVTGFNVETGFANNHLIGNQIYTLSAQMIFKMSGDSTTYTATRKETVFTDYDIGDLTSVIVSHTDGGIKLHDLVYTDYDSNGIIVTVTLTDSKGVQRYQKSMSTDTFNNGLDINVIPGKYTMSITGMVSGINNIPTTTDISQTVEVYKFPSTGVPTLLNDGSDLGKTFEYTIPTPDIKDVDSLVIDHANTKVVLYSYNHDTATKGNVAAEIVYGANSGKITANYDQTYVILEIHVPYSVDGVDMPMYVNTSLPCKVQLPPSITSIDMVSATNTNELDITTVFNDGIGYTIDDSGIEILDEKGQQITGKDSHPLPSYVLLDRLSVTDDDVMSVLPTKIIARAHIHYIDDNNVAHTVTKSTTVMPYQYIHEDKIDIRRHTFPVTTTTVGDAPVTTVDFNIGIFVGNNTLDIGNSEIYMSSEVDKDTIDLDGETPTIETTFISPISTYTVSGGIHQMTGGPFVLGTTSPTRIISGTFHVHAKLTYTTVFGSKKTEVLDLGTIDINTNDQFVDIDSKILTYEYVIDAGKPHPTAADILVITNRSIIGEKGTSLVVTIKPSPIGTTVDNIYDSKRLLTNTLANFTDITQSINIDKGFNSKRIEVPLSSFPDMFKIITGAIGRTDMLMGVDISLAVMSGTKTLLSDKMSVILPKFTEILNLPKIVEKTGRYGTQELTLEGLKVDMHMDSPVTGLDLVLTKVVDTDPDVNINIDLLTNLNAKLDWFPITVPDNKQEFFLNYNVKSTLGSWLPDIDSVKSNIKYSFDYVYPNNPDPLIVAASSQAPVVDNTGVDLGKNVYIIDASIKVFDYTGDKIGVKMFDRSLTEVMKDGDSGKYANGKYMVRRYIDHVLLDKVGNPAAVPPVLPELPYVETPIEITKGVTLGKPVVSVIDTTHVNVSGFSVLDPDGLYPSPVLKVTLTDVDGKEVVPAVFKVVSAPYADIKGWQLEEGKAYRIKATLNNTVSVYSDAFSLKALPQITHITTALNGHDITASIDVFDKDGTLASVSMHLVNYLGVDLRPPLTTSPGTVEHFDSVPDNNAYFIKAILTDNTGITVSKTEPVYGLNNKLYTHEGTIKLKNIDYTAIRGTVPLEEEISDIIESFKPIISNTNQDININNIAISDPVGDSIGTDFRVELLDENGDPLLPVHVETLPLTTKSHLIHAPSPLKYKVRISTGMISYISEVLDCSKAFVINPPVLSFSIETGNLFVDEISIIDPKSLSTSTRYQFELLYSNEKEFYPRKVREVSKAQTLPETLFNISDQGMYKIKVSIDNVECISGIIDINTSRNIKATIDNPNNNVLVENIGNYYQDLINEEPHVIGLFVGVHTTPMLKEVIVPIGREKINIATDTIGSNNYRVIVSNSSRTLKYFT